MVMATTRATARALDIAVTLTLSVGCFVFLSRYDGYNFILRTRRR